MTEHDPERHPLADLTESQRRQAMTRFDVLRPHLYDGVSVTRAAAEAKVALRTAERWLSAYRDGGLVGLAREPRANRGERRLPPGLVTVIEALYLRRPAPSPRGWLGCGCWCR
jgi:putative transposase